MTYHVNIITVNVCLTLFAFSFYVSLHSHLHHNRDINAAYIICLSTHKYLKHYYINPCFHFVEHLDSTFSILVFFLLLLYHYV